MPQYFFNFNLAESSPSGKASRLADDMISAGIKENIKLVSMPLRRNTLMVRLENLADNHDLGES
jgi:hypothetical protein